MPLSEILARSQRLRENMTLENLFALICSDEKKVAARYLKGEMEYAITYGEYKARAFACAAALRRQLGAPGKDAFIAIQLDTCPEWFSLFWGVMAAGYNAVLLDATLNETMTGHMLEEAGAVALIGRKPRALPVSLPQFTADSLWNAPADPAFRPSFGTMVALCTSGTTATSRIFVYDQQAICSQVLNSELLYRENQRIICDKPGRNLAFLPYHHVFGFMVCLQWIHFIGYENIYLHDRSPQTIQDTCRRFHVTHLIAVPLLANNLSAGLSRKLAKEKRFKRMAFKSMRGTSLALQAVAPGMGLDLARKHMFKNVVSQMLGPDIRCIILGGSHTPKKHMRTLSALGYYTVSGFGMTETGVTSVETGMSMWKRTSGSVGRPLSSAEYTVRDAADEQRGEMYIKGNTVHTGRLSGGKLLPPDLDDAGWYRTGDVVRLRKGRRMYVEGRAKDVIINESGENVYPDEIEDAFGGLPGVEQLCVLGVPTEEAQRGHKRDTLYEDITLVLNLGSHYGDAAFSAHLMDRVRRINSALPALKRVSRVILCGQPFQTAGGIKVKRMALKQQILEHAFDYQEGDLRKGAAPAAPVAMEKNAQDAELRQLKEKARALYAQALDIPAADIRDDAHFIDELGGDSLQVLSLSLKAEETLGVLIPPEEYGLCTTVNDLAALLQRHLHGEKEEAPAGPVTPITRFEDAPEYQAFAARQQALMGNGQENPYFVCHDSPLMDTSVMAGQKVLNFGSYNYVGMSGRKETREAAKAAIDQYGTSASGSRLLAGEKTLYQELEREIADWKHAEAALVLVGGHSTNVTCVGNFCGKGDLILYDAIIHNSVAQGCQLSKAVCRPFPHNDVAALEGILRAQRQKYAKVLIIIEGAYSMDGDIAPVPQIVALKKKYGCFLMVDEAHSACVIGQTGGGVDEYFGLAPDDIDIKMGTLSKGLGACGGYLAGPKAIIEYMRYNLPGFVFSVGISPPLAAEVLCAIRLLRSDPTIMENMRRNIRCFVEEAHKRGFNTCLAGETAIIPVLVGRDEDAFLLSNMLRKRGVFVPPAVYPAVPMGKARLRFCVISEHQTEQIIYALDQLEICAREAGIHLPE